MKKVKEQNQAQDRMTWNQKYTKTKACNLATEQLKPDFAQYINKSK